MADHVFPEDSGTGAAEGDWSDAANFAQLARAAAGSDGYVVSGLELTNPDYSGLTVDVTTGTAFLSGASATATNTSEARNDVGFVVEADARSGVSLTDSATNYVYLDVDLSADDSVSVTVNTTGDAPAEPSLLLGTVDTSADTVTQENRASHNHEGEALTPDSVAATTVRASDEPVANVKTYGAVGDGVTDDQTAIQDAIDAISNLGGGVVYLPRGTYAVGGTLSGRSDVALLGDGRDVTTIQWTASVTDGLNVSESRFRAEQLTFDFNGNTTDGVDVEGVVEEIYFQFCRFTNSSSDGLDFDDTDNFGVMYCSADANGKAGIHLSTNTTNGRVAFNVATNNGQTDTGRAGITAVNGGSGLTFIGNVAEGNGGGNYEIRDAGTRVVGNQSLGTAAADDVFVGATDDVEIHRENASSTAFTVSVDLPSWASEWEVRVEVSNDSGAAASIDVEFPNASSDPGFRGFYLTDNSGNSTDNLYVDSTASASLHLMTVSDARAGRGTWRFSQPRSRLMVEGSGSVLGRDNETLVRAADEFSNVPFNPVMDIVADQAVDAEIIVIGRP